MKVFLPICFHLRRGGNFSFRVYVCTRACEFGLSSQVRLLATPRTVACQSPLSMGFPRQEYRSGLPCPPPGDLPDPGIKPASPALAGGFSTC